MPITAYLDLPSGLSGDMFLSCLVDAGWCIDELRAAIARLNLADGSISIESQSVMRGPLRATLVSVKTQEDQHRRNLDDIRKIVESSSLPRAVKERTIAVFTRLAHAEAGVHGTSADQVHFHEVGALDSIADIVGVCAGLDAMHIERLYASPVPLAGGWVGSAHGSLPLPAPATLALLSSVHAPVRPAPAAQSAGAQVEVSPDFAVHTSETAHVPVISSPAPVELVTPTAAALLAELATFEQPPMRLLRVGIGAGQRIFAWPNIARLWLGETEPAGAMVQIDTNIDDMNPQFYSSVAERLFSAGAVDVWTTPIQMKKGRPAITLSVLCPATHESVIAELLVRETTTLGLRVHPVTRHEAGRISVTVTTPYGDVRMKLKLYGGQIIGANPEYDDCKKLADERNLPVRVVYESAQQAFAASQPPSAAPENTGT